MSLSELSIKRPVFAWMLMIGLILFGAISFKQMGVSQLPDVDFPMVSISVNLSGASPEIIESDVIDPLESALMGVEGIIGLSSSARMGKASISLEFDINKDIDLAMQDVQSVVSRTIKKLPKEIDPPVISKTNSEDSPIIWLAVTSTTMGRRDLMELVRDRIRDRFTTLDGVGEVHMGGYLDPNLRVWLSTEKLKTKDLTVSDIIDTIQNEHITKPAGTLEGKEVEFNIRTIGEAATPEQFSELVIGRRGGAINFRPITLGEVARVEDGLEDERVISRASGISSVGMGIKKQRGSNAVEVAKKVKEKIAELLPTLPKGVDLSIRFDSTQFIEESIHELNFTLLLSAILTALICWAFLGSFSATINVILAIPTSIIGSFICLYAFGFTLNTFTLLALSLSIGIVVDDAIMVLENIVRHKESGQHRFMAALLGANQIAFAALATTTAIVAIFLPVAFMKGIVGKFFFQFGITISVAVLLSLLEALTLTPMRCSQFLEVGERKTIIGRTIEGAFKGLALLYKKSIPFILQYRWTTLFLGLIVFIMSLYMTKTLKKEFVPAQDQSRLMLRLQMPVGTSLAVTNSKFLEAEKILQSSLNVEGTFTVVGSFSGGANGGIIFLSLKPVKDRPIDPEKGRVLTQQELMPIFRNELSSIEKLKVSIQDPSLAGFSAKRGYPIEFSLRGPNWDQLVSYSQLIMDEMSQSGMMSDVDSNYSDGMPEIQITPDRQLAKQHGVSITTIAETINAMMGGIIAGQFTKDGHRYDIRVRTQLNERLQPDDIKKLYVRNNRGELIPLSKLVKTKEVLALQSISREDRVRAITIFANMANHVSQEKAMEKIMELSKKHLPEQYYVATSGNTKTFQESFNSLIMALLLGVVVAYMVLASQFNSFIHPITVLMALPFSITGALLALYFANQSLNIYSMIGIILLMGIVKKNSIMLVDFTNQMREEGKGVKEALIEACPLRIRPILMTSISTIMGAIPAAIAFGPGAESRIPMAIAVIGGVAFSTLLTLFIVPCVYSLFSHLERKTVHPTTFQKSFEEKISS